MAERTGLFDIETNGLLDTVSKVWCVVVKDLSTGAVSIWDINSGGSPIDLLSQFDTLVGHNVISFDFPVLRKLYGWEYNGRKIDTLLMSRSQRPARKTPQGCSAGPHSVEAWGLRLGYPKIANDVWDHYHPTILERCKKDVGIQEQIYYRLIEEGSGQSWGRCHRLNAHLFHYLQLQEEYGWYVDQAKLDLTMRQLQRGIDKLTELIMPQLPWICEPLESNKLGEMTYVKKPFKKNGDYTEAVKNYWGPESVEIRDRLIAGPYSRVSFRQVDINSNAEVKEFLLAEGWQPKEWNTDDDGNRRSPKFGKDDPFEGIKGRLGKLIAKRIQCRHRLSNLEGWKQLIRPDGRIGTPVGGIASTGRLTHRDVVNVPSPKSKAFFARRMRSIFAATPGWFMVGVDSKGNQVRQLAARMGDEEFKYSVLFGTEKEGNDVHSVNQRRSGAPSRSKAKNFFYGFIFGAGAKKIADTIGISVEAAKRLIEQYLNEMPALKRLIKRLTEEWQRTAQKWFDSKTGRYRYQNGYITGVDGRPVFVDSEHKLLCYALQSDEAIQMAIAYVRTHVEMARRGYVLHKDWGMLIWMHDEFQMEGRTEEIAKVCAEVACDAIRWAGEFLKIDCPHDGSAEFGDNWYETH